MLKNQKGEVATFISIATLIGLTVFTFVSSNITAQKQIKTNNAQWCSCGSELDYDTCFNYDDFGTCVQYGEKCLTCPTNTGYNDWNDDDAWVQPEPTEPPVNDWNNNAWAQPEPTETPVDGWNGNGYSQTDYPQTTSPSDVNCPNNTSCDVNGLGCGTNYDLAGYCSLSGVNGICCVERPMDTNSQTGYLDQQVSTECICSYSGDGYSWSGGGCGERNNQVCDPNFISQQTSVTPDSSGARCEDLGGECRLDIMSGNDEYERLSSGKCEGWADVVQSCYKKRDQKASENNNTIFVNGVERQIGETFDFNGVAVRLDGANNADGEKLQLNLNADENGLSWSGSSGINFTIDPPGEKECFDPNSEQQINCNFNL